MFRTLDLDTRDVAGGGPEPPVTMRVCGPADELALERLARLDSARPLNGTVLAAEIDGRPLAAISLDSDRVVADPFVRTAQLVNLLRARAAQLDETGEARLADYTPRLRRVRAWLARPATGTHS